MKKSDLEGYKKILKDMLSDWKEQVITIDDERLDYDRHSFIKTYGFDVDTDDLLDDDYWVDIHSLNITAEQLRRFGEIRYDNKPKQKPINETMSDVDAERVGIAFAFFCLSKLSNDRIKDYLYDFRDMFRDYLISKNKETLPQPNKGDIVTKQKQDTDITNDVDSVTARSVLDIEMMVDKMKMTKDDWKRYLDI